jgi:hypothetical protein
MVLYANGGSQMKFDRVYWWSGGTECGKWNETAVQAGEQAHDLCVRIRNQGYVCIPGRSSIGAPEGPPRLEAFRSTGLNRYGAIDKAIAKAGGRAATI